MCFVLGTLTVYRSIEKNKIGSDMDTSGRGLHSLAGDSAKTGLAVCITKIKHSKLDTFLGPVAKSYVVLF
jgi:hypothetical protein